MQARTAPTIVPDPHTQPQKVHTRSLEWYTVTRAHGHTGTRAHGHTVTRSHGHTVTRTWREEDRARGTWQSAVGLWQSELCRSFIQCLHARPNRSKSMRKATHQGPAEGRKVALRVRVRCCTGPPQPFHVITTPMAICVHVCWHRHHLDLQAWRNTQVHAIGPAHMIMNTY